MTSLDVCIVVPVLKRPHRVKPLLDNIAASTPEGSYRVLFVATPYDAEQLEALGRNLTDYLITPWEGGPGDYARKCNYGYEHSTEPLIFTGADDLNFHPGWLEAAKAKLKAGIGVVGTNDLGNPRVKQGRHSTHSLVRREYADLGTVDEPRKIYCEQYPHTFTDDEMIQTAIARRAFAFAKDSVVEHTHPHWNKGPYDEVYQLADDSLLLGRDIYQRRRHLWKGRRLPGFNA